MNRQLLHEHYRGTVRAIESIVRQRVPRVPFMPEPGKLTDPEVDHIADLLVAGHLLAQRGSE